MSKIHTKDSKKKILVVDDEPDVCNLLTDYLEKKGFLTKEAYHGREALEILKNFRPDLIILDVLMPVLDGLEFLKHIKSDADYCRIPVIMLTAKSRPQDIDKGISLDADFYLPKPFKLNNLMKFINLLLKEE